MDAEHAETKLVRDRACELTALALGDDLGQRGDITTALFLPAGGDAEYRLVARQAGVLAGCLIVGDILEVYDASIEVGWPTGVRDGMRLEPGMEVVHVRGPIHSVLAAERTLLNFLQRLCGIATLTRAYVDEAAGTNARIYDTRKTMPGWRYLERYAVRCGGGCNHRRGLHDAILIKDNHLAGIPVERLAGVLFEMLNRAGSLDPPPAFVQVEADTLEQAEQIFKVVGVDLVLLDNFSTADLGRAIELRDSLGLKGKVLLEASGGINLDTVRAVAQTGVDRISVGALTHSATALDLALEQV